MNPPAGPSLPSRRPGENLRRRPPAPFAARRRLWQDAAVKFSEALSGRTAPRRVGDVRLRFDGDVLIGEAVRGRGALAPAPEIAFVLGLACALATAVCVLASPGLGLLPLAALACLAASFVVAGSWRQRRARGRRGFVLHFAAHTLRIDRPSGPWSAPRSWTVPFDSIRVAGVTRRGPGDYGIEVEYAPPEKGEPRTELLVAGIRERELEDAHRVAEMMRAAFGLSGE